MVIYLGVNSQIRILCLDGEQKPERAAREESRLKLYISIYSIGGHAPVGRKPLAIRLPTAELSTGVLALDGLSNRESELADPTEGIQSLGSPVLICEFWSCFPGSSIHLCLCYFSLDELFLKHFSSNVWSMMEKLGSWSEELLEGLRWGVLIMGWLWHWESVLSYVIRGTQPVREADLSWEIQPGFPGCL